MHAFLNVLVFTLGTALAPSAPAVAPPAPMMSMGAVVPVFRVAPVPQARGGEIPPPSGQSTCTATCGDGSTVMCSGNTCSAVNENCSAGTRGYAECDGTYTYCAPTTCPDSCTFMECRQSCGCGFGCVADCLSTITCTCECICN